MTDNTLSGYYASLAQVEGKIADQAAMIERGKASLAEFEKMMAAYKADRRELHKAIAALKKRRGKMAGTDPAMPAGLRRTP